MHTPPASTNERARPPRRRVIVPTAPGVDPTPQRVPISTANPSGIEAELAGEDRLVSWGDDHDLEVLPDAASTSNDERLRADIPPHNV
nr:hypothetical protein [Pseudoclavibacter sp. Marseille-Q3772]